ncbi:MAG: hypothetical protein JKY65_31920 [Planctomycetes bacterium]|nr:hypothetical protein [Planctomycetota bacterium]
MSPAASVAAPKSGKAGPSSSSSSKPARASRDAALPDPLDRDLTGVPHETRARWSPLDLKLEGPLARRPSASLEGVALKDLDLRSAQRRPARVEHEARHDALDRWKIRAEEVDHGLAAGVPKQRRPGARGQRRWRARGDLYLASLGRALRGRARSRGGPRGWRLSLRIGGGESRLKKRRLPESREADQEQQREQESSPASNGATPDVVHEA